MYNIKTQIGGPGGTTINPDSVTVLVKLDAKRRWATVRVGSFEAGGHTYSVDSEQHVGHHVPLDAQEVGNLVLNVACSTESTAARRDIARVLLWNEGHSEFVKRHSDGTYSVPSPERSSTRFTHAELKKASMAIDLQLLASGECRGYGALKPAEKAFDFVLECLADAFADYCRGNPDPDHLPSGWAEVAQVLLGSKRSTAIYERCGAPPSRDRTPSAREGTAQRASVPHSAFKGLTPREARGMRECLDDPRRRHGLREMFDADGVKTAEMLLGYHAEVQRLRDLLADATGGEQC